MNEKKKILRLCVDKFNEHTIQDQYFTSQSEMYQKNVFLWKRSSGGIL